MLEKCRNIIQNLVEEQRYSILKELQKKKDKNYKQRGRPTFSAALIRYDLLLRYTSKQAYKLLPQNFPLPSFSLIEKIQRGGAELITAAKSLLGKGHLSLDFVLIVVEMYLQKGTQFLSKEYIGARENDEIL